MRASSSVDVDVDVLVVGGGSTGICVGREAALRGYSVMVVERSSLAGGTSGRFHGLLHSGGRYVVSDPRAASECAAENQLLREIAPEAIEDTGGLFVSLEGDDPAYVERFPAACKETGVVAERLSRREALRLEPGLNPGLQAAFWVPDASVDVWRLAAVLAGQARAAGAMIAEHHEVSSLRRSAAGVVGAVVSDLKGGEEVLVSSAVVVNATGAWSAAVAAMAGCEVEILASKGVMVAVAHRVVHHVVNRCVRPQDGDIIVPIRSVAVVGTTDVRVADPGDITVEPGEVAAMMAAGERLVPGFAATRALRTWAGVRPLYRPPGGDGDASTRTVSRAHALLDHAKRDGVEGFVTITGGKLTTARLMAEETVDLLDAKLRPSASRPRPVHQSQGPPRYLRPSDPLAAREAALGRDVAVCECEAVGRDAVLALLGGGEAETISDLRRRLRVGMGPCQGAFCAYRCAGLMVQRGRPAAEVTAELVAFWQERLGGTAAVSFGAQGRQDLFDRWLYASALAPPTQAAG